MQRDQIQTEMCICQYYYRHGSALQRLTRQRGYRMKTSTDATLLKKIVTKCGLGLDTPRTDNDMQTWTAWAETNWQGQEGTMMVATRLCAQLKLSVVDGRFVETGRYNMDARPHVAQICMISNKPVQDKLAGLTMASDGTLPHAEDIAFTSHARLAKYVMDEVRHNAGDKSSGATAFPAPAILYDVLFNRTATCGAGRLFGRRLFLTCSRVCDNNRKR